MLSNYTKKYSQNLNQLIIIDRKGIILDSDSSIFGKPNTGKHISSLHPFFETFSSLLEETKSNEEFDFLCVNLTFNNTDYIVDITFKIFENDENAIILINDLTTQYNKYQPIAQLRNESKIKSQILDFQNQLLLKKEVFKNNFIANFSHELKMPLNKINGISILLENSKLSQSQLYNVNVIKNSNERLKNMIDDILDISKIETGHFSINEKRFNLHTELQTLIDIYKEKCLLKGLNLKYEIDKDCPKYVVADKYRLAQIESNLIGNAIKFTKSGEVSLKVKCISKNSTSALLEFHITDTGVGITKAKQKYIFDSFYQIDNTLPNKGAGLGLAIVKRIVEKLNGKIIVESKENVGTTFKVSLELKVSENQEEDDILIDYQENKSYLHKVLIAENLKKDQKQLFDTLNQSGDFEVVIVDNGDDIVMQLFKNHFDLIIMNLNLPKMDGIDTARFIRYSEHLDFTNIPIIALSDNPSKKEELNCAENRIDYYLAKPYKKNILLKKTKSILQKKRTK